MTQPSYNFHVFICQNERPEGHSRGCCHSKGSSHLLTYMKSKVKALGIPKTRINKAGCLDQCESGVAVVIYPEGTWYQIKSTQDVDQIVESHLQQGIPVTSLLMTER
ncbi:MAG: (2Fe-2S) ferredoxin domain-containing protein [Candidatus Paracaedibacteraceae bacterium]|nr:(2Fe-2S) ferredoxin domain-containing protein [Candidatus Paracaedibacteraceae bacterium]